MSFQSKSGLEIRRLIRDGKITGPTPGMALGYVQANVVIVPSALAVEFHQFCIRNPKPCPMLAMTSPGEFRADRLAAEADIRIDVPCYRIYKHGQLVRETNRITDDWRDDLVTFLLGCSFSFENALLREGVPVRHVEMQCNVPMYRTNFECEPSGIFHGPMVVSMRPMTADQAQRAKVICARFPLAHGGPVQIGNAADIGVADIDKPDYGDAVEIRDGEVPVFWACGVTPQAVAVAANAPLVITHKPGHMFVTDLRDEDLEQK